MSGPKTTDNVIVTFAVPRALHRKLQAEAKKGVRSMSADMKKIIMEHFGEKVLDGGEE